MTIKAAEPASTILPFTEVDNDNRINPLPVISSKQANMASMPLPSFQQTHIVSASSAVSNNSSGGSTCFGAQAFTTPTTGASNGNISRSFEDFPGEIRQMIYELVLVEEGPIYIAKSPKRGSVRNAAFSTNSNDALVRPLFAPSLEAKTRITTETGKTKWVLYSTKRKLSLLLANKNIYCEAIRVLYAHNTFRFHNPTIMAKVLRENTSKLVTEIHLRFCGKSLNLQILRDAINLRRIYFEKLQKFEGQSIGHVASIIVCGVGKHLAWGRQKCNCKGSTFGQCLCISVGDRDKILDLVDVNLDGLVVANPSTCGFVLSNGKEHLEEFRAAALRSWQADIDVAKRQFRLVYGREW